MKPLLQFTYNLQSTILFIIYIITFIYRLIAAKLYYVVPPQSLHCIETHAIMYRLSALPRLNWTRLL